MQSHSNVLAFLHVEKESLHGSNFKNVLSSSSIVSKILYLVQLNPRDKEPREFETLNLHAGRVWMQGSVGFHYPRYGNG